MKPHSNAHGELTPLAWRIYRFGLATGGLAWICIASTLCGCSSANGWVKNQSGRGYYHRGNYAAARSEFERALMDDPYNPTYAYNVGKVLEKQGDAAGAEKMYQHALTLDPSHQPAYRGMTTMLASQGRQNEAVELLTAWSQTQPYSAASHVELAQLHRKTGNFTAAEQELNTALQIRPRYRQALNERTRLGQQTGRPVRGGAYSELALTSRADAQATAPGMGMMAATPQTSPAISMANSMPQRDPTMASGVIQASYGHPQMSAMPTPMVAAGPQMYQANRFPTPNGSANGWMPSQQPAMAAGQPMMMTGPVPPGNPMLPGSPMLSNGPHQVMAAPGSFPMSVPPTSMSPAMLPAQPSPMAPQPIPTGLPVQQPIELGQPVPITQVSPGGPVSEQGVVLENAPPFSSNSGSVPMVSVGPTVQAF